MTKLNKLLPKLLPTNGIPFRTLISLCLFLTLGLTATVSLWFYYSNTSQMVKQNSQTYNEQQRTLTQLTFDSLFSDSQNMVSVIRQDQPLLQLIQTKPTPKRDIQARLDTLIEYNTTAQVDLLVFIPTGNKTPLIGGQSPYQADTLIKELKNFLPNTGFHFIFPDQQTDSDSEAATQSVSALVYGEEIIAGKFGKRLGYLFGVTLLNDNYSLLNKILTRTGASAANLVVETPNALSSTQGSESHLLSWINKRDSSPIDLNLNLYTPDSFTITTLAEELSPQPLKLILWNETSYIEAHKKQFQNTLILVVVLIMILGFGIAYLATRISSKSLSDLKRFALAKTTHHAHIKFTPTPITEINQVGRSLERAVHALATNEEMYRNILNKSGAVVYIKDLEGRFHFINTEFEKVTGKSMIEVVGKTDLDLFDKEMAEEYRLHDKKVVEQERVLNFREDFSRNGDDFSFISVKFPIRDHQGVLSYVCGFSTDITGIIQTQEELSKEKARAEEATQQLNDLNKSLADTITKKTLELEATQESLIQSEKLASLGSLVAGISHELNTPIGTSLTVSTAMEGRIADLEEDFKSGALSKQAMTSYLSDLSESNQILIRSLSSAIELISSFKQLSVDQTSQQRRAFSLRKNIDEVATTYKHLLSERPIQVMYLVEQDVELDSFPGALSQVLNNLIHNATNHAFSQEQEGEITITANLLSNSVQISVSDNGQGIASKSLKKVFDPFYTTKMGQGGSGLGLHIVHSIVTGILGGSITINSRHGGMNSGTDFLINIPLTAPAAKAAEPNQDLSKVGS